MQRLLRTSLAALSLALAASVGLAGSTGAVTDTGCTDLPRSDGGTWRCTFSDDFSASTLDASKWQVLTTAKTGFTGGGECMVDDGRAVAQSRGLLHLTTRSRSSFVCTQPSSSFKTTYSSGAVYSKGRFSQAFGRFSFRARFPDISTAGLGQALWLYPDNPVYGPWPKSGEIDLAEHYSAWPRYVNQNVKYEAWDTDQSRSAKPTCKIADPSLFHTYTLEWTRTSMRMTYDDVLCWDTSWTPASPLQNPQPFDQPFHLIMNQSIGTGTNAPTSALNLPETMDVDWVRAWS